MTFVGLSEREEMEIFGVINGKAKGLSNSLLDFHDAQLCADLASERPELLVALHLKNEPTSPWYNRLDLGGNQVSGLERRASLRTMQKACRILTRAPEAAHRRGGRARSRSTSGARSLWSCPRPSRSHASSLVTKGIGVYALTELAADFVLEATDGDALRRRSTSLRDPRRSRRRCSTGAAGDRSPVLAARAAPVAPPTSCASSAGAPS